MFLKRTPIRTFIANPLVTIVWDLVKRAGNLNF
jgi:hypothetical protein